MSTNIDKQTVLVDGLDKVESKLHLSIYQALKNEQYDDFDKAMDNYRNAQTQYGELFTVAHRINDARYKRVQRIKSRVSAIIRDGNAIFLTLTFTDEVLASTSPLTRRRYVSRFLKSNATVYVANLDYGEDNQREHYHAIVLSDMVNYADWRIYGNINGKRIRNQDADITRTSKYVAKLTFHAIKKTASFQRMIFSR